MNGLKKAIDEFLETQVNVYKAQPDRLVRDSKSAKEPAAPNQEKKPRHDANTNRFSIKQPTAAGLAVRAETNGKTRNPGSLVLGLAHLRAALQWAKNIGLLIAVPNIQRPTRAKKSNIMKGRPITKEEFDRMLAKTADIVGEDAAPSWRHYLDGLWWSGLRLAESLDLYWDDDSKLCVTVVGGDVMLRVPAELEKGHKDRMLPIAPEFAEFLTKTDEAERTSRVFKLVPRKLRGECLTADRVTRIVSAIGRAANAVVDKSRNKFATAHDLRRSFGERWAERVMPQVLMELMRHESIETTLKYYVGHNARRTSKVLREAYESHRERAEKRTKSGSGDTSRDTHPNEDANSAIASPENEEL